MDTSYDDFHRSLSIPIAPYPLAVPSGTTLFDSTPFRSDSESSLNVYASTYIDITSTYPSTSDTISKSYCSMHQTSFQDVDVTIDHQNIDRSSALLVCRSDCCLVCSDRASGIHFGVSTCEACKAFFRRTSLSACSIAEPCAPIRCEINAKNRNNCPGCRFDKCKRLGMDRDNVIYGKPSKQQVQPWCQQDHLIEQFRSIVNQLAKLFQNIYSNYQALLFNTLENQLQIKQFGHILSQVLYADASANLSVDVFDVIRHVFALLFDSSKSHLIPDSNLLHHPTSAAIMSVWLFVYYYETFLFKQKLSQDKLTLLTKLLEMESTQFIEFYDENQSDKKDFRVHFMNMFTKFASQLHEIHSHK